MHWCLHVEAPQALRPREADWALTARLLIMARRHCPDLVELKASTPSLQVASSVLAGVLYAGGCGGSLGRLTSLSLELFPCHDDTGVLVLTPLAQLTRLTRLCLAAPVGDCSGDAWLPPSLVELRLTGDPDGTVFTKVPPLGASWMLAVRACTRLKSLELWDMAPCDVQLAAGAPGTRARSLAGTLAQARAAGGGTAAGGGQPRVCRQCAAPLLCGCRHEQASPCTH